MSAVAEPSAAARPDGAARGRARLRAHLELGRVSNLPTVWSNALAATVLCGGAWTASGLALAASAFSCLYVAGMYFNDVCDAAEDARDRPARPIPSGRVSIGEAGAGAAAWCALGFALGAAARALSPELAGTGETGWLVAFASLAAAIALYDLTHASTPLSPVLMALCRTLTLAGAALLVAPVPGAAVATLAALGFAWILGLTRLAKDEAGGGAVRRRAATRTWPYLALGLAPAFGLAGAVAAPLAGAVAVALVATIANARRRMRSGAPGAFPAAVGSLVAAVALVDALALARAGHGGWALAGIGCFALTLLAQRRIAGS